MLAEGQWVYIEKKTFGEYGLYYYDAKVVRANKITAYVKLAGNPVELNVNQHNWMVESSDLFSKYKLWESRKAYQKEMGKVRETENMRKKARHKLEQMNYTELEKFIKG